MYAGLGIGGGRPGDGKRGGGIGLFSRCGGDGGGLGWWLSGGPAFRGSVYKVLGGGRVAARWGMYGSGGLWAALGAHPGGGGIPWIGAVLGRWSGAAKEGPDPRGGPTAIPECCR